MKIFSQTIIVGKKIFVPTLVVVALAFGSCSKEGTGNPSHTCNSSTTTTKTDKMNKSVERVLRDFASSQAGGSSQQAGSGSGSSTYSNVTISYTTYSTANGTVYSWSDPTTGTSFTLAQSSNSGGGLGQLAYNGKSFDYNYVLCIKASMNDPNWNGFMNGRDLRGVVAIDGDIDGNNFTLRNLAIFFVATTGGTGTYKFIDFGANTVSGTDGLGEIVDFSNAPNATLSALGNAKIYVTSGGNVNVGENSFEMGSGAKVMDVITSQEYPIDGTIMCE